MTEISIQKSNQLKSIAILMMLFLHLFNRDYKGLFQPLIFIGNLPLSYYISLFCDACVPIFAFVSGYGLFFKFQQSRENYNKANLFRIRNLYINFWIILILFVVILGTFLSKTGYPGDLRTFIFNFTAIDVSYNGAWWFLTTYILFVLTSSFWFNLILKINPYVYLIILGVLYVLGFYFRVYKTQLFSSMVLHWIHTQGALYFCTLLQFMLGAFVLHFKIHSKITNRIGERPIKNYFLIFGIVILVAVHGLIPNFFIAPITGLAFILLYCQLDINPVFQKGIDFFTPHATNIWLVHMFFYIIYFQEFVYSFKFVMAIYLVLIALSVASSYVINFLNKKALQVL